MSRLYIAVFAFAAGALVGQYSIKNAYDPKSLEEQALMFAFLSHYIGCQTSGISNEVCFSKSDAYIKSVESIWHDKAWGEEK